MVNQELDYDIPYLPLTVVWLCAAAVLGAAGVWIMGPLVALGLACIVLLWVDFSSTIVHYALDAESFTRYRIVGPAFVRFQSHHFPQWINVIYKKPKLHLIGELNPIAIINLVSPLLLFRMHSCEVFIVWGDLMLASSYGMLCHRWAHEPDHLRPAFATALQRAHLALQPEAHWKHHALAVNPGPAFVPNYNLAFGWSNALFNRVLRVTRNTHLWVGIMAVCLIVQVPALTLLLHWMERR